MTTGSPLSAVHRHSAAVAACGALACLASWSVHAEPSALDQAQRISVWGTPVASASEGGAVGRAGAAQGMALEQSRWGGSSGRAATVQPVARGRSPTAAGVEITDLSYRWGLSNSRSALNVGVGAGAVRLHPDGVAAEPALPPLAAGSMLEGRRDAVVPTLSIGLRHRLSDLHRVDLYASGTASLPSPAAGEFYSAKMNVEWLPTKNSGLGFEQSAVNLKFGANSNFALRVRSRGPMIYYRSKF